MKKVLVVDFALLIGVAFVSTGFAQGTKVGTETKPAEKGPGAVDTGAPSAVKADAAVAAGAAKAKMFKGEVVKFDEAAKTLVVKDAKGEKTFDVTLAKNMPALKAGDKVSFNYIEKDGKLMAGNFQKAGTKAPPKGAQEAVSAGVPVPKPAPAPAPAK